MSSIRYAAPLRLELRRSRRLALCLAAAHAGALACSPLLPRGWRPGALLAALILLSLARSDRVRVMKRGERSVVARGRRRGGDWQLSEGGGGARGR